MSIFAGLAGGIKGPDVAINADGGSLLPTTDGMRFSSAQINQQDTLLSGIKPYDYGAGSTSDDIAHQIIPHKIQKIVPEILLPSSNTNYASDNIMLAHSVDDGDLAFTIRMLHENESRIKDYNFFNRQNLSRAVDTVVNLATVNYILRGLQTPMEQNTLNWEKFLQSTGWPIKNKSFKLKDFQGGIYQHRNLSMFVQEYIRPLGVVIGSDKQGGQHQGHGGRGVDFPVDYVVTILVDGLCDNMLNLWRRCEIRAGDDLFLALCGYRFKDIETVEHKVEKDTVVKPVGFELCTKKGHMSAQFSATPGDGRIHTKTYMEPSYDTKYVLNHWSKGIVEQRFNKHPGLIFELVPTTSSEIDEGQFLGMIGETVDSGISPARKFIFAAHPSHRILRCRHSDKTPQISLAGV